MKNVSVYKIFEAFGFKHLRFDKVFGAFGFRRLRFFDLSWLLLDLLGWLVLAAAEDFQNLENAI